MRAPASVENFSRPYGMALCLPNLSRATTTTLSAWLAVAVVALALYVAWPRRMVRVYSHVTGKAYLVKGGEMAQDVADRLAFMELRVRDFLHKAEAYAPGDPRLHNIRMRWDGTLYETPDNDDVAYSIGKGAVSICVRTPDGRLDSENTGMFVLLHELAHVATDTYGHSQQFWANMRFLLELAERTGSYTYQDFDSTETSYCGRRLAASPLSCVKNATCASQLGGGAARSRG